MTVYVRKDVRRAVKLRLFEKELETSALVEELLSNWLVADDRGR